MRTDLVVGHLIDFATSNADQEVIGKQTSLLGQAVLHNLDNETVLSCFACVELFWQLLRGPTWDIWRGWPWSFPPERRNPQGSELFSLWNKNQLCTQNKYLNLLEVNLFRWTSMRSFTMMSPTRNFWQEKGRYKMFLDYCFFLLKSTWATRVEYRILFPTHLVRLNTRDCGQEWIPINK